MAAVAVVAYLLANVIHEGLGHAGACLLLSGCNPQTLTTAYFESETSRVSAAGLRWLAAGGTLANAGAGLIFLWLHRFSAGRSGALRYFVWCAMTVNLFVAAGYPLFSGSWAWATGSRSLRLAVGTSAAGGQRRGALLGAVWTALVELSVLVGTGRPDAVRRGVRLTLVPYVAGSFASTFGALLNPSGAVFIVMSAAAHFGGTSGLAWMAQLLGSSWLRPVRVDPVRIPRSWAWIGAAAVALFAHIAILGPGLTF